MSSVTQNYRAQLPLSQRQRSAWVVKCEKVKESSCIRVAETKDPKVFVSHIFTGTKIKEFQCGFAYTHTHRLRTWAMRAITSCSDFERVSFYNCAYTSLHQQNDEWSTQWKGFMATPLHRISPEPLNYFLFEIWLDAAPEDCTEHCRITISLFHLYLCVDRFAPSSAQNARISFTVVHDALLLLSCVRCCCTFAKLVSTGDGILSCCFFTTIYVMAMIINALMKLPEKKKTTEKISELLI